VTGDAGKLHAQPALPRNPAHHAHRQSALLQHGTLLNVDLRVGKEFSASASSALDAFFLHPREIRAGERPGQRAAAQVTGLVAHAFLVAEPGNLHVKWQLHATGTKCLHRCYCHEHAEGAVVFPGVAHGIEM
jgi:hypothetical protein